MARVTLLVWTLYFLLPALAPAAVFKLKPDLTVTLPDVPPPWSISTEPNSTLVDHLTEHVLEEAAEKEQHPTREQAHEVALKRARHNQLFVVNERSGAHLLISFSHLEKGESAPSAKMVAQSARFAAEGVSDEGWTIVSSRQAAVTISGAQTAQWFMIDYLHEGQTSLFMGIVGFADPYWFWLYGNDHLQDPRDRGFLEKLIMGIKVQVDTQ